MTKHIARHVTNENRQQQKLSFNIYHQAARVLLFSVVSVCVCLFVRQHDNS